MAGPGTWAYLELGESDFFRQPLPQGVVASAFANWDLYLVLANYTEATVTVDTTRPFIAFDKSSAAPGTSWTLPARSLAIRLFAPSVEIQAPSPGLQNRLRSDHFLKFRITANGPRARIR
jgi:hypothetical protein